MKLLSFLCFLPMACGGSVASTADSGTPHHPSDGSVTPDAGALGDASAQTDAAAECGQPSSPTYSCMAGGGAEFDGGACGAYGADATAKGPAYPLGCMVTTSTCDPDFGGALTCNCQTFPGSDGGPEWICAL